MLQLSLELSGGPRHLVALGAHPDDIEIGCGATLLRLAATVPSLTAEFVIATGDDARIREAGRAAELFLPGCEVSLRVGGLPDGRLPGCWNHVKELLESSRRSRPADLVFLPSRTDAHQDHRLLAELAPTVWRDHLLLGYELPKWDGDLAQPWCYVPLADDLMQEKVRLLAEAFPSQLHHDWFDTEVFLGLARLRGMECRVRYAEAFTTTKTAITW